MQIVWSKRFRDELRREIEFIYSRNPQAALAVRGRIVQGIRRLRSFPYSGRSWRLEGCRELVLPGLPYIVIYQLTAERVIVVSLFHESRDGPHVH